MELGRGWRDEQVLHPYDTTGRTVPITTGVTIDERSKIVPAIAIGTGPSVVLTAGLRDAIWQNMHRAIAVAAEARRNRPPGTP